MTDPVTKTSSAQICPHLLAAVGNPHRGLRVVHVGGTNGKGSTVAMIESACRSAGLHTGLFTSPHLYRPGERIRIDGQPLTTDVLLTLLEQDVFPAAAACGLMPTDFEAYTVAALLAFARAAVDLAIVEVGVGGTHDGTNVFADPLVTVITTIGWDHVADLGPSLADIASAKAGILRSGRPVFTGATGEALAVIRSAAIQLGAPCHAVRPADALAWSDEGQRFRFASGTHSPFDGDYTLPLLGDHQLLNAALALHAISELTATFSLEPDAVRRGLATVQWPGRMEVANALDHRWLLDGAHNGDGAAALRAGLTRHFPGVAIGLVFGARTDKPWPDMVPQLNGLAEQVWLTPVPHDRSELPKTLATADWGAPTQETGSFSDALFQAWRWASSRAEPTLLVVTGSLSLVGACRHFLSLD